MMEILYHLTIPRPAEPDLDAVIQETEALRAHIGGELIYVNPSSRPGSWFPERLYGLHRLPGLRWREVTIDLHHIYNSHLYAFPYLRWLRKPVVYTITAGLRSTVRPKNLDSLSRLTCIIVSNTRHLEILQGWGLGNVSVIPPGIDTGHFTPQPTPNTRGMTLLMASAPWTVEQFESKGINALLEAASVDPDLRLIFLWRGVLAREMRRQIAQSGLEERATLINQRVNVNDILAQVHAAIVLASDATLVKAFPHSLLEALAAGRPVLVSRTIPMADYVERTGCGKVVERITSEDVLAALAQLESNYDICRAAALRAGQRDFSVHLMVKAYRRLYSSLLKRVPAG